VPPPHGAVGLPEQPERAAALVEDAPRAQPERNLELTERTSPQRVGLGFVRAADGKVYLLHLVRIEHHPEALERRALVRWKAVPEAEKGGELRLPTVDGKKPIPVETRESLRRALEYEQSLRSASFVNHLRGTYETVAGLLPETKVESQRFLLLDQPLTTKLAFPNGGGAFAHQGIAAEGVVSLESYSGIGTRGDMAGQIDVRSYGYVYIDGDLTGTVNIGSYTTIIVEGDLKGTLKVRSYTDFLLRGRITGTLDCNGSCWSTFYFERHMTQEDLERLGPGFRSVTLHLRSSDLPDGKHEKIGSWREVIVGDPLWKKLAR
jgi:hypothetical protein